MHVDLQLIHRGALVSKPQKLQAIPDGLSGTLALSEVRSFDHPSDERGAWALPWNGSSLLAFDMHAAGVLRNVLTDRAEVYTPLARSAGSAQPPNNPGPNADTLLNCDEKLLAEMQIERLPCITWSQLVGLDGYQSAAPRSRHTGGVNAAFLDGPIEFLVDGIDEFAMAFMVSVADGRRQGDLPAAAAAAASR